MRIYAISDMHGQLDRLDPAVADLVVIAGCLLIPRISGCWAFETADGAELARR